MAALQRCYRHPDRETRITCATCGKPICTECMQQTAVGLKCPEDAKMPRSARTGVMKPHQIAKTALAGLGVGVVGIFVVFAIFQIGFFSLLLSGVAGYFAGTLILRAGGRNGGPIAMATAAAAILIAYAPFVGPPLLAGNLPGYPLVMLLIALVLAIFSSRGQI